MRKIIVSEFVILDGVMEDPGGFEIPSREAGLFEDGSNRIALKLTEARPIGDGILILIYHPEIDVKTIQSEPEMEREKERR